MSGADAESRAGAAGYEQVLKKADQSVASFEEEAATPLRRLQHFLHAHPTAIPAIVLILAIILFWAIAGQRFMHPFNFSLVLQQVTIGTNEVTLADLAPTGAAASYRSAGGEVRVRVVCSAPTTNSYSSSGDLLTLTYDA